MSLKKPQSLNLSVWKTFLLTLKTPSKKKKDSTALNRNPRSVTWRRSSTSPCE